MEAVVAARLKATGVEETKAALQDMRAQILNVSSAKLEDAKETRGLARDARALNQQNSYGTQIWLAQHPAINNASKAMSVFGSVARTALSVISAISLVTLAFQKGSSQLLDLQGQLAKVSRDMQRLADAGQSSSDKFSDLKDEANVLKSKIQELNDQAFQESIMKMGAVGSSVLAMGSSILMAIPAIIGMGTANGMAAFSFRTLFMAMGPVGWIITALTIALPLIIQYWPQITAAFMAFASYMQATFGPVVMAVWNGIYRGLTTTWVLLKQGALAFWNGMVSFANIAGNAIITGVEMLANGYIAAINGMISVVNRLASALHLPTLPSIGTVTLPHYNIPLVTAATGFEGKLSQDTLFQAHKGEDVSIVPPGRSGRGGGSPNITIIVQGSIASETDFFRKADAHLRRSLQRSGFQS